MVLGLLCCARGWAYSTAVAKETFRVLPCVGVVLTSTSVAGFKLSHFLAWEHAGPVIINEVWRAMAPSIAHTYGLGTDVASVQASVHVIFCSASHSGSVAWPRNATGSNRLQLHAARPRCTHGIDTCHISMRC